MADPDLQIRGGGGGGVGGRETRPRYKGEGQGTQKLFFGPLPGSVIGFIFLPCLLSSTLFPKLPFMTIGNFLVYPGLCIKAMLSAQPLIWK